jgi:hypothetical protein
MPSWTIDAESNWLRSREAAASTLGQSLPAIR